MRQDLHNNISVVSVIDPVDHGTGDTATVGAIIDTQNCRGVEYVLMTGSLADADATFTVLLEEGDDAALGDNTAIADANLLGTEAGASFTFAEDNTVIKIGARGTKRYQRLTLTPANNTGAALIACAGILYGLRGAPDTDQQV